MLLVIVMEASSKMLFVAKRGGASFMLFPFLDFGALNISYLFADNTLSFCGAHPYHLRYLCALFLCFEAIPDLKINMANSELVPVGNVTDVDGLAGILGCGISFLPLNYLGLPLWASFKANSF
jgi:hypothetical protein